MDERYDWMSDPEEAARLYRGLSLVRNMAAILYRGPLEVGWSSVTAPYRGVMIASPSQPERKTILINPGPLLQVPPGGPIPPLLPSALKAVSLHEAGHAAFTPPTAAAELYRRLEEHRAATGYTLPREIVTPVSNWVEDVWVEGHATTEYPGFGSYFRDARRFFLPDDSCDEILETAYALWPRYERDLHEKRALVRALVNLLAVRIQRSLGEDTRRDLLVACINLLSVLVNRPGVAEAACQPTFRPLAEAAAAIRRAGGEADPSRRVEAMVQIADDVFRFLADLIPEEEPNAPAEEECADLRAVSSALSSEELKTIAREIDPLLSGQRIVILRDDGDPLGCEPAAELLSQAQATALEKLAKGASTVSREDRLPDEAGQVSHQGKYLKVVRSSPTTLPKYDPNTHSRAAEELLRRHRGEAEELKRRLAFRDGVIEQVLHGQRSGELDEDDLVRAALGEPDIYRTTYREVADRVDLTLLVDESGSMVDRWQIAAAAVICVEYAVRDLDSVRLRVYGFTSDCYRSGETTLFEHYDSARPELRRFEALGWTYAKANNADGIALAGVRNLLGKERAGDLVPCLLMISDGQPYAIGYNGKAARDHVRREVAALQGDGVRFAHLQIGETEDRHLNHMYGRAWIRVTRTEEIPGQVVALITRWLSPAADDGG